jgi:hypothetical protein
MTPYEHRIDKRNYRFFNSLDANRIESIVGGVSPVTIDMPALSHKSRSAMRGREGAIPGDFARHIIPANPSATYIPASSSTSRPASNPSDPTGSDPRSPPNSPSSTSPLSQMPSSSRSPSPSSSPHPATASTINAPNAPLRPRACLYQRQIHHHQTYQKWPRRMGNRVARWTS